MRNSALLAVAAVIASTAAQLAFRSGMQQVGPVTASRLSDPAALAGEVLGELQVLVGFGAALLAALLWLLVLSRLQLSVAYSFLGLTYVMTALFGRFVLDEQIPAARWAGTALVIAGVLVVGRTASEDTPPIG